MTSDSMRTSFALLTWIGGIQEWKSRSSRRIEHGRIYQKKRSEGVHI